MLPPWPNGLLGLSQNHIVWFFNLLEQNIKELLDRFLEYKDVEKAKPRTRFLPWWVLGFWSHLSSCFSPCSALLSLSKLSTYFLCSLSLEACSFLFFFLTHPRFFSQTFGKEKQKWELMGQKLFIFERVLQGVSLVFLSLSWPIWLLTSQNGRFEFFSLFDQKLAGFYRMRMGKLVVSD